MSITFLSFNYLFSPPPSCYQHYVIWLPGPLRCRLRIDCVWCFQEMTRCLSPPPDPYHFQSIDGFFLFFCQVIITEPRPLPLCWRNPHTDRSLKCVIKNIASQGSQLLLLICFQRRKASLSGLTCGIWFKPLWKGLINPIKSLKLWRKPPLMVCGGIRIIK